MNKVDYVRTLLGEDSSKVCDTCTHSGPILFKKKYHNPNFLEDHIKYNVCKRHFAKKKVEKTYVCQYYSDGLSIVNRTFHHAKYVAIPIAVIDIISWVNGKKWYIMLIDAVVVFFNFFMAYRTAKNQVKRLKERQ